MECKGKLFSKLSWELFSVINNDKRDAFERMCLDLFIRSFLPSDTVQHANSNNVGIEIEPILERKKTNRKQRLISFQAKYFDSRLQYRDIENSLKKTVTHYSGHLDLVYLFCNKTISRNTKLYTKIENILSKGNIELIPITNEDIFSLIRKYPEIETRYFRGIIPTIDEAYVPNNDNDDYLKTFHEPLFLESHIGDGNKASLYDVYVSPRYIEKETRKRKSVERLLMSYFAGQGFPHKNVIGFMIMGKPGSGKSSFIAYLAMKLRRKNSPMTLHIVRLRNMKSQQINHEDPITGLLEYLNLQEYQLKDTILMLDGLDEICALYQNSDFHSYLRKLLHDLSKVKGLKLIITSRTGYFAINDEIQRDCYILTIDNWDNKDLEKWSNAYAKIHPGLQNVIVKNTTHLKEEKYSDKKDIFAVPILFYMANARGELLSKHDSICSVYDAVLSEVTDKRNYDHTVYNHTHRIISPQLAHQICIEIAFTMFRCGRLSYMTKDDPFLEPSEVEVALQDAIKHCDLDVSSLTAEDKRRIKDIYALTFYYNKDEANHNAVEFAHRTIAEYFTSKKILQILCKEKHTISEEQMCLLLSECFGYAPVTPDIFRFLYQKVQMKGPEQEIIFIKTALEQFFLDAAISGGLFLVPQKYISKVHPMDRISIMLKSTLTLFEYLNCRPPIPNDLQREEFNNLVASASRCVAIHSQHQSLLPFALNGFDLSHGHFSGCEFADAHFSGANLFHSEFCDSNITDGAFSGANIELADFSGANISGADFSRIVSANGAEFTETSAQGTDFSGSHFHDTSFDDAEMQESILQACVFDKGCHFDGTNLYGANLDGADISQAKVDDALFEDEEGDEEKIIITGLKMKQSQLEFLSANNLLELKNYTIIQ
nr:pentapeptide repeat-containing protein [Clostridia bacterium]